MKIFTTGNGTGEKWNGIMESKFDKLRIFWGERLGEKPTSQGPDGNMAVTFTTDEAQFAAQEQHGKVR